MLIGNDVVDLREPRCHGKAADARFVRRVFAASEADRIGLATNPDLTLWALWAGKEAAYKVAVKMCPRTIFAHRRFAVRIEGEPVPPGMGEAEGRIVGSARVPVGNGPQTITLLLAWEFTDSYIHCIATSREVASPLPLLSTVEEVGPGEDPSLLVRRTVASLEIGQHASMARLPTPRERVSARSPESLAVRQLAKTLAYEAGLGEVEIVREPLKAGFGPPMLVRPGAIDPLEGWDVSLSHDGTFVAAVLVGSTEHDMLARNCRSTTIAAPGTSVSDC